MLRSSLGVLGTLAAVSLALLGQLPRAAAEDFRVDNTVYKGAEKEATTESTTIFHAGIIYDIMKTPLETMMFDTVAGRFCLLNMSDRTRAELSTDDVLNLVEQLKPLAAKSREPLVQFLANPEFQERIDENVQELTLSSTLVNYRITMSREATPEMVRQYREFSDWSARLNVSWPPFGRLKVNAALAAQQAIPVQVMLNMSSGKGMKPQRTSLRSEHRVVRPLSQEDLDRVAKIREAAGTFKLLDFKDYRNTEIQ